jgi:hypothetical protein
VRQREFILGERVDLPPAFLSFANGHDAGIIIVS